MESANFLFLAFSRPTSTLFVAFLFFWRIKLKTTLSALLALGALTTHGGPAFAAEDAHAGYQRGFYGKTAQADGASGKAASDVVTTKIAFTGPRGGTSVLTTTGVQAWDRVHDSADKVSSGASSSDGHEGYRTLSGARAR
jgi:hypothetical protein